MSSYSVLPSEQIATAPLTWETLAGLEPKLLILERELLASPPPRGQRLWIQYDSAKARLCHLVGWFASSPNEILHSSKAYEVALRHVVAILERRKRRRAT